MVEILRALRWILIRRFRSRARVEAENLALRHQLNVVRRQAPRRPQLRNSDRLLFVWLYRLCPDVLASIAIVRPETVVRWHRRGFKAFWRWKSRGAPGRPRIPKEIRDLIREVSIANPLWGAPRLHGELLKVGIDVAQSTVAKYMVKGRRPPSQSWKTFLRNHADGIASIDFFVVPTVAFKLLYAFVILRHDRRWLVHLAVTTNPTADWIAQQISEAFPWERPPRYLMRDRDGAYGGRFKRRVRAMGIRDRPTAPQSPWQNGYVERLIGSIRRECLDHVIVFGEVHLRRVLGEYANYYNGTRTHLSLGKDAPLTRAIRRDGRIQFVPHLGGLHHSLARI
ncbi:MAG: integrase core domain-containing protein [Acidiferrobacterales bacterium]